MDAEGLAEEETRLKADSAAIETEIAARGQSAREILDYTLKFSELVKNAGQYFKYGLDTEKRDLVVEIFSELVYKEGTLVKYGAKDGFGALLGRPWLISGGGRIRTFGPVSRTTT